MTQVIDSTVERVYAQLKDLAISFELRPGDRINEGAVARRLGVSRTPLREALNRLAADGFLTRAPKSGFFRRPLDPKELFDLYELRNQIEMAGVRLAVERAEAPALVGISGLLDESSADVPGRTVAELVRLDEEFHERLMTLTGNDEMLQMLRNINARIRFVRWIDMAGRRNFTQGEHRAILTAVQRHDANTAVQLMNQHISRRLDQIVSAVKEGYARIYMGATGTD